MQSSPWRIDGHTARLEAETFRIEIDLLNPSAGVRCLEVRGMALHDAALFCVMLPQSSSAGGTPVDFFSRGNDLVAVYGEAREHPFRAQIYWRLLPSLQFEAADKKTQPIAALELILSIQTSLLDSDPALMVETALAANEVSQLAGIDDCRLVDLIVSGLPERADAKLGAGCFVFRPVSAGSIYIEMVHPADFRQSTLERVEQNGPVRLSHRLFAERLEKGVILRSRIRGIIAADANPAAIARSYQEFAASDPPLTA
ncbi:MAG TPA: hypothetical protein VG056_03225 [Pirellulales bacterium]|jgi:hypothetical protein|nr:hypothetical protein [Pirellulales bacterium]